MKILLTLMIVFALIIPITNLWSWGIIIEAIWRGLITGSLIGILVGMNSR